MYVCVCMCVLSFLVDHAFSGYFEALAYEIKLGLKGGSYRRKGVTVDVTIPFTKEAFAPLRDAGYLRGKSLGRNVYGLEALEDWDHLLGKKWYLRIVNKWIDFCYVHVDTVQFYLRNRKPITEPLLDQPETRSTTAEGVVLVFRCVRMQAGGRDNLGSLFP